MDSIRDREVLQSILLQVLAEYPDGLHIQEVYEEVDQNYTFPAEWYREIPRGNGYDELEDMGISDWREIPQEELVQLVRTEPQWQNELRWVRNNLKEEGYLDTTAKRGVWRLNTEGMEEAATDPTASLSPSEREIATPEREKEPESNSKPRIDVEEGKTRREALESKLEVLTSSMPVDDLELLVEVARVIRLRSLER